MLSSFQEAIVETFNHITTEERLLRNIEENRSLLDQVASDIELYLSNSKDHKKGLKLLSKRSEIHEKTLARILAKENKPGYITLYKLYRQLLNTESDTDVVNLAPKTVSDFLKRKNPKNLHQGIEFSPSIARELLTDRAWSEIYFIAGAGKVTRDEVKDLYGAYGIQTLEKMKAAKVLEEVSENIFVLGKVQTNLTSELLKTVGIRLTDTFFNPEMTDEAGENHIALFSEGLSQATYNAWLKIDEEAFRQKIALTKVDGATGNIRAFTFMVIDKLKTGKKIPNENIND